ncbi:hypothetical protein ACFU6K_39105, partial [Kitasatospora sp. NPDC057512]|uniref:hypothetical protein n=1 Tax=Kitasatospora sp. NPDC057512 TaxID=3346154 RepID=UPI0036A7B5AF
AAAGAAGRAPGAVDPAAGAGPDRSRLARQRRRTVRAGRSRAFAVGPTGLESRPERHPRLRTHTRRIGR